MRRRKLTLHITVLAALFAVAALPPRGAESNASQRRRPSRAAAAPGPQLICRVYCSETQRGTSVAEILWKISEMRLAPQAFEARQNQQELEVAVNTLGFEKGASSKLRLAPGANRSFSAATPGQRPIPGLDTLVVADVRRASDDDGSTEGRAMERRFGAAPFDTRQKEAVVVRVEGLKPGMRYFWRVPTGSGSNRRPGQIVECEAAVCPVDAKRPAPNP